MINGASVTIDLSSEKDSSKNGLRHVMNELCKSTISADDLQKFINNYNNDNYDLSKTTISSWAPSVDGNSFC